MRIIELSFFILFFLSLIHASITAERTLTLNFWQRGDVMDYGVTTDAKISNTFFVSTTATVLDPAGGNENDLGNNAIICPGEVTLHAKPRGRFSLSKWRAVMPVAATDDDESTYTPYSGFTPTDFTFSSTTYRNYEDDLFWHIPGLSPFSPTNPEEVTFVAREDAVFEGKKGLGGGVISSTLTFCKNSDCTSVEVNHDEESLSYTLTEGSYTFSTQLHIDGVIISITRDSSDDSYDRTYFAGGGVDSSLAKQVIHIDVINANSVSLELLGYSPSPAPPSGEVTLKVKNTGPVAVKITSILSATPGYSVSLVSGGNQPIPPGEEKEIIINLRKISPTAPSTVELVLSYESTTPLCSGDIGYGQLNVEIEVGMPKPDLYPKITFSPPFPVGGQNVEIIIEDCNGGGERAGFHYINYSFGDNMFQTSFNTLSPGECRVVARKIFPCKGGRRIYAFVDSTHLVEESDETNNEREEMLNCLATEEKECEIDPSSAMLIPSSSQYFSLSCDGEECDRATWEKINLDENVELISPSPLGVGILAEENAPSQEGQIKATAKKGAENYVCYANIKIQPCECEDFI